LRSNPAFAHLAKRESEPFELPGRLDFSEPIPILRDDASVPATHLVSSAARRVGDGVK